MEVNNYPDYLIYPDGRIWSKKRNIFMNGSENHKGYKQVRFTYNKIRTLKLFHRLVAEHYIPNPENKPQVDHINRNRQDNRVENLRWVSLEEQAQNKGQFKNNTSGHKCIFKQGDYWRHERRINHRGYVKTFNSKIDCICYKFIFNLKTACKIR